MAEAGISVQCRGTVCDKQHLHLAMHSNLFIDLLPGLRSEVAHITWSWIYTILLSGHIRENMRATGCLFAVQQHDNMSIHTNMDSL